MITRRQFLSLASLTLLAASRPALARGEPSPDRYSTDDRAARISFRRFTLTLRNTWGISRGSMKTKDIVLVDLTRDGVTGRGEAAPSSYYGETADTSIDFIGRAASAMENRRWDDIHEIERLLIDAGRIDRAGLCAVTMALLDWQAKRRGLPLRAHLGVTAGTLPLTSFSIGIDAPARMLEKVKEASAYPILKIKVGFDGDIELIGSIRAAARQAIRVDANGGWKTKENALERIQALKRLDVEFVEQPLPPDRLADARWLRSRSPLPIIADEGIRTERDLPSHVGACDGINIKLMKCGGIPEALRMIATARRHGLRVMLGCMIESSLAISAAAHIAARADYADLDGNLLVANDPFTTGVTVNRGRLTLPSRAGIGIP